MPRGKSSICEVKKRKKSCFRCGPVDCKRMRKASTKLLAYLHREKFLPLHNRTMPKVVRFCERHFRPGHPDEMRGDVQVMYWDKSSWYQLDKLNDAFPEMMTPKECAKKCSEAPEHPASFEFPISNKPTLFNPPQDAFSAQFNAPPMPISGPANFSPYCQTNFENYSILPTSVKPYAFNPFAAMLQQMYMGQMPMPTGSGQPMNNNMGQLSPFVPYFAPPPAFDPVFNDSPMMSNTGTSSSNRSSNSPVSSSDEVQHSSTLDFGALFDTRKKTWMDAIMNAQGGQLA